MKFNFHFEQLLYLNPLCSAVSLYQVEYFKVFVNCGFFSLSQTFKLMLLILSILSFSSITHTQK